MADAFISEEVLAHRLNITREKLRPLRPQNARTTGGTVEWPWADAETVAKHLKLPLGAPTPEKTPEDGGEDLTVESSPQRDGYHFANKFLIQAKRKNGEVVTVRVLDSSKYVKATRAGKPMELRAMKAAGGNWWLLTGREPRWKGVW